MNQLLLAGGTVVGLTVVGSLFDVRIREYLSETRRTG